MQEYSSVTDLFAVFQTEDDCIRYLENLKWSEGVTSPFDVTSKVYKCKQKKKRVLKKKGKHKGVSFLPEYVCKKTRKKFTVLTATIFKGGNLPLRDWMVMLYAMMSNKSITGQGMAEMIGITQPMAWSYMNKIRKALKDEHGLLGGNIESDTTYYGGSESNKHYKNRKRQKKGSDRRETTKTSIMGAIERDGRVRCKIAKESDVRQVKKFAMENIELGSTIITDEYRVLKWLKFKFNHITVNHSKYEYTRMEDKSIHTNTMEGFWTQLKTKLRNHVSVSKKHLQGYIDEVCWHYNMRGVSVQSQIEMIIVNG